MFASFRVYSADTMEKSSGRSTCKKGWAACSRGVGKQSWTCCHSESSKGSEATRLGDNIWCRLITHHSIWSLEYKQKVLQWSCGENKSIYPPKPFNWLPSLFWLCSRVLNKTALHTTLHGHPLSQKLFYSIFSIFSRQFIHIISLPSPCSEAHQSSSFHHTKAKDDPSHCTFCTFLWELLRK